MSYSLTRINPADGAGIGGAWGMFHFKFDDEGNVTKDLESETPQVGWQVYLDNPTHWYRTSPITEIISTGSTDEYDAVTFKTENSTYNWKKYK